MRRLDEINDFSDLYQVVPEEDIEAVESRLEFAFPAEYRSFLKEPDIEAIKKLPSLLWFVRHPGVGILDTNIHLRKRALWPFPEHLIAFATNECGDYYCFDRERGRIVYIAPNYSVEENLERDELVYDSFDQWLEDRLQRKSSSPGERRCT
jgi:hypothetical protein